MLSRDVTCGPRSGPGIGNVIVIMVMASHRITYISLQPLCLPMTDRVSGRKCLQKMLIIMNIFFASDEPVKHIVLNPMSRDCFEREDQLPVL